MATNYEILMNLSQKQMAAFIRSLVNKDVSRYIDWASWLNSEDPDPSYIGEEAFVRRGDIEIPCRFLEEGDENGDRTRTVFFLLDKGGISRESYPAHLVRKASESIYPSAPLIALSEEELREAAEENDSITEEILAEAEAEEQALDDLINESISLEADDELLLNPEPAEEIPEPEPAYTGTQDAEEEFAEEEAEAEEPAVEYEEQPEEEPVFDEEDDEIPDLDFEEDEDIADPEIFTEEKEEVQEPEPEPEETFTFDEEEEEIPDFSLEEEEKEQAAERAVPVMSLDQLLFGDNDDDDEVPPEDEAVLPVKTEEPQTEPEEIEEETVTEPEPEPEEKLSVLDDDEDEIWKDLESQIQAADRAEEEATNSLRFDDLWSVSPRDMKTEEQPAAEEPQEPEEESIFEDDDNDEGNEFFSRGRIEMLKEELFDDDEEPPLHTGDLVFRETTAIEVPRSMVKKKEPEAEPVFDAEPADFTVPKAEESKGPKHAEPDFELGPEDDADTFFDRLMKLSEEDGEEEEDTQDGILAATSEFRNLKYDEPEDMDELEEDEFRSAGFKRFLSDIKRESMLYDPDDPEDQELPTIAFSAMSEDDKNSLF